MFFQENIILKPNKKERKDERVAKEAEPEIVPPRRRPDSTQEWLEYQKNKTEMKTRKLQGVYGLLPLPPLCDNN